MLAVIDDFGNEQHWTIWVHGYHSLALYGYANDFGMGAMLQSVDFADLEV